MGLELALNYEKPRKSVWMKSDGLYQQFNIILPPRNLLSGDGHLALIRGDYEKARVLLFGKEATTSVEYGNRQDFLWAHARVGYVALHEGNFDEAAVVSLRKLPRTFRRIDILAEWHSHLKGWRQ